MSTNAKHLKSLFYYLCGRPYSILQYDIVQKHIYKYMRCDDDEVKQTNVAVVFRCTINIIVGQLVGCYIYLCLYIYMFNIDKSESLAQIAIISQTHSRTQLCSYIVWLTIRLTLMRFELEQSDFNSMFALCGQAFNWVQLRQNFIIHFKHGVPYVW